MGISVEACENCGNLFHYPGFGTKYCPACRKIDEENREKVKAYIKENGSANMYQISLATGIPQKLIKQYLRDGMLEIPEGSPIYIKCEGCGCDIRSGRWCPECAVRLNNDLKAVYFGTGEVPKERVRGKMYFLGKRDNSDGKREHKKTKGNSKSNDHGKNDK